ncbi:MAG: hypothetical protein JJ897_00455 [Marinibacterium sp.]|nr:hypothetical protein [Marinibacterium sp.]
MRHFLLTLAYLVKDAETVGHTDPPIVGGAYHVSTGPNIFWAPLCMRKRG